MLSLHGEEKLNLNGKIFTEIFVANFYCFIMLEETQNLQRSCTQNTSGHWSTWVMLRREFLSVAKLF